MHPDLERERFIAHLVRLQQEIERLRMDPDRRELRTIQSLKEKVERLEADNAVLRSRLSGRPRVVTKVLTGGQAVPVVCGEGCRYPKAGLGELTYAQMTELHVRQLDSAAIAALAGVHHATLSRWRKANSYVMIWTQRVACGSNRQAD